MSRMAFYAEVMDLLYGIIRWIAEFFFIDVPHEAHMEHDKRYGIPDHAPFFSGLRSYQKVVFIIKCTLISVIVLALPVLLIFICQRM